MKWTPWILSSLMAFAVACGGEQGGNRTQDTGSESGTMQGGASTDTAVPGTGGTGTTSDTTQGGAYLRGDTATTGGTDSARGNQTESGVTDTRTGKSTLGRGVTETRPDQGEAVTSKGDTLGHPAGH